MSEGHLAWFIVLGVVALDGTKVAANAALATNRSHQATNFNTCHFGTEDNDFRNYELMVHEAGHALGLSGFPWLEFWRYQTAHPTIPDSVMNYDSKVSRAIVPQGFGEPDCSPHPFDIMAIEALYQTVSP